MKTFSQPSMRRNAVNSLIIGLCAAIVLPVSAADKKSIFYECDMTVAERFGNLVSKKMGVVFLEDDRIFVTDQVTLAYAEGRMFATRDSETAREVRFSWHIEGRLRDDGHLVPELTYRAQFDKSTKKLSVRGRIVGRSFTFRGKGQCAERERELDWRELRSN